MAQVTSDQMKQLDALYVNGQLEGIDGTLLDSLSEEDAEMLIRQCEEVPPHTYQVMPEEMRTELTALIRRGMLPGISETDLIYMTEDRASTLLWLVTSSDLNREELATRAQRKRVKKMVAEGFLAPGTARQFVNLTRRTAEALIEEGEKNIRNAVKLGRGFRQQ
ncbi:hypothetical protein [uncultured Victivallis sp.]|uniref:hypothetical protein n=1 Tax=uncultured Victivallis sp. TaxID=354118 RepID=UPI002599C064|nr:hypothetical protein [uncultured Victivallis sp.]